MSITVNMGANRLTGRPYDVSGRVLASRFAFCLNCCDLVLHERLELHRHGGSQRGPTTAVARSDAQMSRKAILLPQLAFTQPRTHSGFEVRF